MRSETRRKNRDRKSFHRRAWESRAAREIQTGGCRGGQPPVRLGLGRGENESKVGDFKVAVDWRSGLDPHRSIGDRQLSFLATAKAKKFRYLVSHSGKKHRRSSIREPEQRQGERLLCRRHSGRNPDARI